jgi:hypothetical protein
MGIFGFGYKIRANPISILYVAAIEPAWNFYGCKRQNKALKRLTGLDDWRSRRAAGGSMKASKTTPLGPLKMSFEIFRDKIGHWCARRTDGKVGGIFPERDAAVRFARRECRDESMLVLIMRSAGEIVLPESTGPLLKGS